MNSVGKAALLLGVGVAAVGIGIAISAPKRRRRKRRGLAEATTADQVPYHTLKVIGDKLEEAENRARRAGAVGDLSYIGTGQTGIVFCDQAGKAFKVSRSHLGGDEGIDVVEREAEWLRDAAKLPAMKRHVARGVHYDKQNHVLVRECVIPSRDARRNETRLHALHQRLGSMMKDAYGRGAPEYKPDSYVYTRDRGPVLVDAGFAHDFGRRLVKDALDFLNKRRPLRKYERVQDLAFDLRMERGATIPAPVANKLLRRLKEIDPGVELDGTRRIR